MCKEVNMGDIPVKENMWILVAWVFYIVIYPNPFVQTPVLVMKPTSLSLHSPIYTLLCGTGATTLQTILVANQLQVRLCQQGWRKEQGLSPSSLSILKQRQLFRKAVSSCFFYTASASLRDTRQLPLVGGLGSSSAGPLCQASD